MPAKTAERRVAPRFKATLDVRLLFKASPHATPLTIRRIGDGLPMIGSTHDISETGIGVIVSARNIDRYVTSPDYVVQLELILPAGPVVFTVRPVRHGRFTMGKVSNAYFIGAMITDISEDSKQRLRSYLDTLLDSPA
ncbi:MAG: hypothetical protein QOD75_356 [Blastocatellia bacterium]|jgi:hypothetical protein|nr:hypothetical protein [Blastocatellia bacterium]